ncbi:hypothetical protein SUNI508_07279 [Seiridium unicorne]|uniref:Uncharacterized protein n=1 Tax=Seiridium unicorne TaxID=138068 RepID=A0ABR2UXX6_9PEZI
MDAAERAPSAFRYMDDASLALVIELQQEDGTNLADMGKGKQREGECNDAELALQLYLDELAETAQFALDRRMTGSIQMAIREDADTLVQLVNQKQNAQTDRSMSVALSRGAKMAPTIPSEVADDLCGDKELMEKMSCLYVTGVLEADGNDNGDGLDSVVDHTSESSAWAASRLQRPSKRRD